MTMSELKDNLMSMASKFMTYARLHTGEEPGASYQAFRMSENCRMAAESLQPDPVEAELEGGGHTWWYVCPECHGAIDDRDHYCRHCGQALKWNRREDA